MPIIYVGSILACAVGWELWFTYGWIDGDPVEVRRAMVLNTWLPKHINGLMNSFADAGTVCLGGLWLMPPPLTSQWPPRRVPPRLAASRRFALGASHLSCSRMRPIASLSSGKMA